MKIHEYLISKVCQHEKKYRKFIKTEKSIALLLGIVMIEIVTLYSCGEIDFKEYSILKGIKIDTEGIYGCFGYYHPIYPTILLQQLLRLELKVEQGEIK